MKTTPAQKDQREPFFSQDEIKGLYKFVRERLAYHEAIGELNPGDVARKTSRAPYCCALIASTRSRARASIAKRCADAVRGCKSLQQSRSGGPLTDYRPRAVGASLCNRIFPKLLRKKRSRPSARKSFTSINRTKIYTSRIFSPTWTCRARRVRGGQRRIAALREHRPGRNADTMAPGIAAALCRRTYQRTAYRSPRRGRAGSRTRPGICARASAPDSRGRRLHVYRQGDGEQFVIAGEPKIVSSHGNKRRWEEIPMNAVDWL